MSKEENKANETIVKYYIRTLSLYDHQQIGIDSRVAWDRLTKAKELYTKVFKPLDKTKVLSKLQLKQLQNFMAFTPHEEYIEVTQEALMNTINDPLQIQIFTSMGMRAIHILDKIAAGKCVTKATELCADTFKDQVGKDSRQFYDITRAGIAMVGLADNAQNEILTLA